MPLRLQLTTEVARAAARLDRGSRSPLAVHQLVLLLMFLHRMEKTGEPFHRGKVPPDDHARVGSTIPSFWQDEKRCWAQRRTICDCHMALPLPGELSVNVEQDLS